MNLLIALEAATVNIRASVAAAAASAAAALDVLAKLAANKLATVCNAARRV